MRDFYRELSDYFNSKYGYNKSSIVHYLVRDEKKLIREFLGNLLVEPTSNSFNFDALVEISLNLMYESLKTVHPILAGIFEKIYIPYLPDYEKNVRGILTSYQDHIVHSVNVYILGLYLTDQLKTFKDKDLDYIRNDLIFAERDDAIFGDIDRKEFESYTRPAFALKEFLLRWKIAAFFHDTEYTAEISSNLMEHSFDDILDEARQGDKAKLMFYSLNMADKYLKLKIPPQSESCPFPNLVRIETDVFFIFSYRLSLFFFTDLKIETIKDVLYENFIKISLNRGFVEHGFFSALIFINELHHSIKADAESFSKQVKYSQKERKNFYTKRYELTSLYLRGIDAATSILLHNLQYFKHPEFKNKNIESRKSPLAFMLKLCDELQVWTRFKGDFDKSITGEKYRKLRDRVDNQLHRFDLLGKYSRKSYLNLAMKEKTFCIDGNDMIKINREKLSDQVLEKMLYKIFSEPGDKGDNDKINPDDTIKDIEEFVKAMKKELEEKPGEKVDLDLASDGKTYIELLKKNNLDINTTLLLAAIIYKTFLDDQADIHILDNDQVNLNKWEKNMGDIQEFIEKCMKGFSYNLDKSYGFDRYYLDINESGNKIYIRYPDRNKALKIAKIVNTVLKLSDSKDDLVTVVEDRNRLRLEQDFFLNLLKKMIEYILKNTKKGEEYGQSIESNGC